MLTLILCISMIVPPKHHGHLRAANLVVFPIIYMVLYIPGGAGFLPSTVCTPNWMIGKGMHVLCPEQIWRTVLTLDVS